VAQIRRPPFPVKAFQTKIVPMSEAELSRFVGLYRPEGPIEASAELANGRLKMVLPGGKTLLLAPVSPKPVPDRRRSIAYVSFDISAGRVERAVVEEGDAPVLTLIPKR